MMKLLTILFLSAWTASGATYYIDYSSGSDANNGTAKATPWKKAPGMKGFAGTYSHVAGDRFIFKGGVTWPAACYQWKITWGGTSTSVRDYYGVDVTWYSGGSFTRPKFDFERVVINGWTVGAGVLLEGTSASYVTFDNLEFLRHGAPQQGVGGVSTWGCTTICLDGNSYFTLTNSLVRDWWQSNTAGVMPSGTSGGGGIQKVNAGVGHTVTHCEFHQENSGVYSGSAMWNIVTVEHTEVHHTPQAIMSANIVRYNHIHDLQEPGDPAAHANVMLLYGNVQVYNNLIHDTTPRAEIIYVEPGSYAVNGTAYIWNNVAYNVAQEPISIDNTGVSPQTSSTYIWNNTLVAAGGVGYCVDIGVRPVPPYAGSVGTVVAQNNHFITSGSVFKPGGTILSFTHSNNLTNTLTAANALGYTVANEFAPTDATKPTVGGGLNLSAYFTNDIDGNVRSAPWDIGAYEWNGAVAPEPGTLVLSAGTATVAEDGGTVTVTVHRTGGSDGIVGCTYGTADGTALAGVNYTTATGTLSWANADAADKTFTISVIDSDMLGNLDFTATISAATGGASLGTPATQTITVTGTGVPPTPPTPGPLIGWTWPAIDGVISPPFTTNLGYIYQPSQTIDLTLGGSARYTFTNSAGFYRVECEVDCIDGANDSWGVSMNTEPTSPTAIWDVLPTPTVGWETRTVGWRGTGAYDNPEFPEKVWYLDGGTNTLIIRGRETGKIKTVTLASVYIPDPVDPTPPPVTILSATSGAVNGYYNAADVLTITLTFSTNVTVTGTPTLALNSGGTATYATGSTGTNLVFGYTVAAGETSAALDYTGTNALSLNGGTIRHGAEDADLTLPVPGAAGSVSHQKTVVIDTTAPTVTISAPTLLLVTNRLSVSYLVTFADLNWDQAVLPASSVVVTRTGTANATVGSSATQDTIQTVTLVEPYGTGTLTITIPSGAGRDLAGNVSPLTGPSTAVTVDTYQQSVNHIISIHSGTYRSLRIGK